MIVVNILLFLVMYRFASFNHTDTPSYFKHWTLDMDSALVCYVDRLCQKLAITPARLHPHEVYLTEGDVVSPKFSPLQGMYSKDLGDSCASDIDNVCGGTKHILWNTVLTSKSEPSQKWQPVYVGLSFGHDRSVVAERSSLPDSSSGVSSRMWVRIPAVTLVSLSKTLNHNCFSPPRG